MKWYLSVHTAAAWSGTTLFDVAASKVFQQTTRQMSFAVIGALIRPFLTTFAFFYRECVGNCFVPLEKNQSTEDARSTLL